jgi:hypothetical protein
MLRDNLAVKLVKFDEVRPSERIVFKHLLTFPIVDGHFRIVLKQIYFDRAALQTVAVVVGAD